MNEDQFRAAVNNQKINGTVKWPLEKRDFLSSVSKSVLVLIQKLLFNDLFGSGLSQKQR